MTIHHDKLAYGKLASQREELSEEKLLEMARLLAESAQYEENEEQAEGPWKDASRSTENCPEGKKREL